MFLTWSWKLVLVLETNIFVLTNEISSCNTKSCMCWLCSITNLANSYCEDRFLHYSWYFIPLLFFSISAKFEHERSSSPPRPVRKPSPDIDDRILGYLRNEKDLMSKLAPERLAAERLATERLVLERLAPERRPQENMAPDRMSQERNIPDRQALDRPPVSSGYSTGFNAGEPPSSSFNTSINFDNPTVQKALDNLIMSGPSSWKASLRMLEKEQQLLPGVNRHQRLASLIRRMESMMVKVIPIRMQCL